MHDSLARLCDNIHRVFIGKPETVRLAITALLARGHLLIEDVPGLGKTLLARALAQSLDARFKRIQFTPDLLPSDVTGVSVYNPKERDFEFIKGPVFSQVLLADEINRTSPRTQSSLLESMEEQQVTVDGMTLPLPEPFFVLATQNPIELGGTYPLPEAQIDRFLMRLTLGYPESEDEIRILDLHHQGAEPVESLEPVIDATEMLRLQREAMAIRVGPEVKRYIVDIVAATRRHSDVTLGISPRGSVALMRAAQAWSFFMGADYVAPDAVKAVASSVLAHRIILDTRREYAGISSAAVLQEILGEIPIPVAPRDREAARTSS